jgi:nitrate/nitrite transport system substrate-binding protein
MLARTPFARRTLLQAALGGALLVACGKKEAPPAPPASEAQVNAALGALELEKTDLKLGFIKLTDCAPLVIAKEKGFFKDEGLNVSLEAQANWKVLLDRVIGGELDGAHMLAGQPLGARVGIGTQSAIVTALNLSLNGNAITVSNAVWAAMQAADPKLKQERPQHPISARSLVPVVEQMKAKGTPLQLGMVFPVSTHNYELRYWLAAAGIHPGFYTAEDSRGTREADVLLSVTPPPQMPATLEAGTIQGYCVGEPWNQQAISRGIGVPVTTSFDVFRNKAEKVFGVTEAWAKENPKSHVALIKALIRAGQWLDANLENRKEASRILSRKEYVGADYEVIANSMTGTFVFQKTDRREMADFVVFHRYFATYPFYSDAIWYLTQMRRWGQIREPRADDWYHGVAKQVYRPDVYVAAARELADAKLLAEADVPWKTDGYRPPTSEFVDGKTYDGRKPNEYLASLAIGHKDSALPTR